MIKWITVREYLKKERVILLICLATFIISLGYAFAYRIAPIVDAKAYDKMGWNIAQGNGFRLVLDVPIELDDAITYQGPMFQFFLAGIYSIFGHHIEAVWIVHALLRAFTVYFMFATCRLLFSETNGRRIGLIAGAFIGFYPDLIEIAAMIMTETLFLFLSVLTLYIFARLYRKISYAGVVAFAFVLGLTVLTRSTILAFSPFFLYFLFRQKARWQIGVFFLVLAAVLTPWAARNYFTYHAFIPTMANFGYNLIVGNRVGHDGEGGAPANLPEISRKYGMIGANVYGVEYFKQFLREHPFLYVKLTMIRGMKYFSPIRPIGFWFYQTGWKQMVFVMSSAAASFVLFVCGFVGIFAGLKERKRAVYYLCWFSLVTAAPVIGILVETRYRFPIYPFMAIFAGFAISGWMENKKIYQRYFAYSLLAVTAIGGIDLSMELPKVISKVNGMFLKR